MRVHRLARLRLSYRPVRHAGYAERVGRVVYPGMYRGHMQGGGIPSIYQGVLYPPCYTGYIPTMLHGLHTHHGRQASIHTMGGRLVYTPWEASTLCTMGG